MLTDVVPTRGVKPVLQNIKVTGNDDGTLTLAATDLEIGMTYRMPVEELADPETVLLPATKLHALIRDDWSDTIAFKTEADRTTLTTQNGSFQLLGAAGEDFPEIQPLAGKGIVEMAASDFLEAAEKVLFATAKGDSRFALNGVLLAIDGESIEFVASDTHRLSCVRKTCRNADGFTGSAIVITKGIQELARLCNREENVRLQIGNHKLIAETARASLVASLVDGQFPRYRDVIPSGDNASFHVAKESFSKAMRLAGQLTNEETRAVSILTDESGVVIRAIGNESGSGELRLEAEVVGTVETSFNFQYVLDMLRVLPEESVRLIFRDNESPVRVESGDFTHIIMPIRARG